MTAALGPAALLVLLACILAVNGSLQEGSVISGTISGPAPAAGVEVKLQLEDGRELLAWPKQDGSFEFRGVPAGSHLLHAFHLTYFFPQVRLDTTLRAGVVRATLLGAAKAAHLPLPLNLHPFGEVPYYEKRKPVDVWSFVKSPYGIMIVFSVFIIVVMPRMKVDPEEMKEMQASLRSLGGGGGSSGSTAAAAAPARVTSGR